jgi:hypothetical protein
MSEVDEPGYSHQGQRLQQAAEIHRTLSHHVSDEDRPTPVGLSAIFHRDQL